MKKYNLKDIKMGWQDSETADSYDDRRFNNLFGKISDALDKVAIKKALSKIDHSGKILDHPCGTGRIMKFLYYTGYKNITGADISEQMLCVAKNKMTGCPEVSFCRAEADNTEFPDNYFDGIISVRFMGHIPRDIRVGILREFSRVCKGSIVIEYCVRNSLASVIKSLFRVLTVRSRLPEQWEWHDVSISELERELQEAGIKVIRYVKKFPLLSESTFVVAKTRS